MLDKAYKESISSFCDSIFPSPTVGLAWKTKSSEFHHQVMKITSDFHAKYPEVEESLLFAYAENKFQSVVGYVFGRMQENGRKKQKRKQKTLQTMLRKQKTQQMMLRKQKIQKKLQRHLMIP